MSTLPGRPHAPFQICCFVFPSVKGVKVHRRNLNLTLESVPQISIQATLFGDLSLNRYLFCGTCGQTHLICLGSTDSGSAVLQANRKNVYRSAKYVLFWRGMGW